MKVIVIVSWWLITLERNLFPDALVYPWYTEKPHHTLVQRIVPPAGYKRTTLPKGGFGDWLRNIPLKPPDAPVRLHNGRLKSNQNVHGAVVDVDTGKEDLQQCADAVIRLRAEYLFSKRDETKICFRFTSGHKAEWSQWQQGYRPKVLGNSVQWVKLAEEDGRYNNFRNYLMTVFRYAGSASLSKELEPVKDAAKMEVGDVFIQGGFPGHAVLVLDMAKNENGNIAFLLGQSYMPAQDFHLLRNPRGDNPWYLVDGSANLITPEWTFNWDSLRRFQNAGCP